MNENSKGYTIDFTIPQGPTGPTGETGPAPTLKIGEVTTGEPGGTASVTLTPITDTEE